MEKRESQENIKALPQGLAALRRLLDTVPLRLAWISEDQATARTGPSTWSNKEELGHLIDSAANNHQRLVLVQTLYELLVAGFEEGRLVNRPQYCAMEWQLLM